RTRTRARRHRPLGRKMGRGGSGEISRTRPGTPRPSRRGRAPQRAARPGPALKVPRFQFSPPSLDLGRPAPSECRGSTNRGRPLMRKAYVIAVLVAHGPISTAAQAPQQAPQTPPPPAGGQRGGPPPGRGGGGMLAGAGPSDKPVVDPAAADRGRKVWASECIQSP